MSELQELLAVDSGSALKFFYEGLMDLAPVQIVSQDEIMYTARILAHYAQTSRSDTGPSPAPASLIDLFDHFVLKGSAGSDHELLEVAGSWSILLLGFFPDQMRRRHNINWYTLLGRDFYAQASRYCPEQRRKILLRKVSSNFSVLTFTCRKLRQHLSEAPLLIH